MLEAMSGTQPAGFSSTASGDIQPLDRTRASAQFSRV